MRLIPFITGLFLWGLVRETQAKNYYQPPWFTPRTGRKYEGYFIDASRRYNIPPGLLSRVAKQESDYNPFATNPSGAMGIMQIIPKWHPGLGNPYDAREAIYYAAGYLYRLKNRFGSWRLALAAYNWGPTNLARKGFSKAPPETVNYVAQITKDVPV